MFKWANPGLFFIYFRSFQTNSTIFATHQCEKCHVHPVSGAWIRTHLKTFFSSTKSRRRLDKYKKEGNLVGRREGLNSAKRSTVILNMDKY